MFIVGCLGNGSGRKVFPVRPTDGENPCELRQVNNPIHSTNRVYEAGNGLAKTLKGSCGGGGAKTGLYLVEWGKSVRIRRLTPREVWRLQGFPDEYFDKAKAAGISDSQLYKMAGNAVTVNVARAIGERLKEIEDEET